MKGSGRTGHTAVGKVRVGLRTCACIGLLGGGVIGCTRQEAAPAPAPVGAAAVAVTQSASAAHFPSDDVLLSRIRPLVESGRTKGIVIGVLEADGRTRIVSHGSAGSEGRAVEAGSVFEIGSITKLFTAALLADMVARGEVSLTDPVARYLPAEVRVPSRGGREITLLDLATHRSGLPRMPVTFDYPDEEDPYAHFEAEDLYEFLSTWELERDVGAEFVYSNLGYALLGHALARAAGTTYRELLEARLLEPLRLEATRHEPTAAMALASTSGHDVDGAPVHRWSFTDVTSGAGGLLSNAADLLAFLRANAGMSSSPLTTVLQSTHVRRADAGEAQGVGLGWFVRTRAERDFVWFGGDTNGYQSVIGFDPEKRVGIVVLSNSDGRDAQLLQLAVTLLVPSPVAAPAVQLSSQELAQYEGIYDYESRGEQRALRVYQEGGRLMAQLVGGPTLPLQAQGEHTFFADIGPGVRLVFDVSDGRARGLTIFQGGQEIPGVRRP